MVWTRSKIASASIALAVVLFFALNMFSQVAFRNIRLDLTDTGVYTLSQGTRNTLKAIPEPVTLKFYFSESVSSNFPSLRAYGQRVRDLLQDYAAISGGKIKLEILDPVPFSEIEDQAVAAGIRGAPIPTGERVYFGLTGANSIAGRETVPVFLESREQFLEYDLTSIVSRLTREKKPVLGVVTNLPLDTGSGGIEAAMQGNSQPFFIYEQLRNEHELRTLEQDFDRVPVDVDALLIVHPKPLNAKTLYGIDQFVMRGGRVIAFLDPLSELSQLPSAGGRPLEGASTSSAASLGSVLKTWGVEIESKFVIGDRTRAQRVQTGQGGQDLADYVVWLAVQPEDMDRNERVTANLRSVNLGSVGIIRPIDARTTTVTPIIQSTKDAMEITVSKVASNPSPDDLIKDFLPSGEQYTMAARISGPVNSAFQDGPPKESLAPTDVKDAAKKPEPLPRHLKQTKGPANIILVADADLFNDSFWVQLEQIAGQRIAAREVAGNMAFVLNAVEDLSGSNDLISLRSRGESVRPFTAVDAIRRNAEQRFLREKELLEAKLNESAEKLAQLEGRRPDKEGPNAAQTGDTFSPEQKAELEKFRQEYSRTKRQLREVQLKLNRDIDGLKSMLAGFNMIFVPLLMGLGLLGWNWWRARERDAAAESSPAGDATAAGDQAS
jgi:ABC-type uncharacterized transport system involved in gliding motility auxiliary subunit